MSDCIIGLSGAQCTGKSTFLFGLEKIGFPVVNGSPSREAQKILGWDSLKRVEESVENMWLMQNTTLDLLIERDRKTSRENIPTFVDRTPADIWAYTREWVKRHQLDEDDDKVFDFKERLVEHSKKHYALMIYFPVIPHIKFKAEPNRADLESRERVSNSIREFLFDLETVPFVQLDSFTVEDRILFGSKLWIEIAKDYMKGTNFDY